MVVRQPLGERTHHFQIGACAMQHHDRRCVGRPDLDDVQPRTSNFDHAPLRRVLVTAGILETGNEVLNFLLPIYGHSIGLSASKIGLVAP